MALQNKTIHGIGIKNISIFIVAKLSSMLL